MIGAGARGFASAIAGRHTGVALRLQPVSRVPLTHAPHSATPERSRSTGTTIRVALNPRLVVEQQVIASTLQTQRLVQRVERHHTHVRQLVERTQRVEQVTSGRATASPRVPLAADRAIPPSTPIVVPQLPRVSRRAAAIGTHTDEVAVAAATCSTTRPAQATAPAIDVARLTDEVMRGIDRRLDAWRERRGRG